MTKKLTLTFAVGSDDGYIDLKLVADSEVADLVSDINLEKGGGSYEEEIITLEFDEQGNLITPLLTKKDVIAELEDDDPELHEQMGFHAD